MKKLSLMIMGVLLGGTLLAQEAKFGVMGGLNLSNLTKSTGTDLYGEEYSEETYGNTVKPGLALGVYANIPFAGNDVVSLNPELFYSQLGAKYESDNGDVEIKRNLHVIELPVLLKFNIVPAFHLVAGPSFSYLVGGKDKFDGEGTVFGIDISSEGEQDLDMDEFNRAAIGGVVGLGFDATENLKVFGKYGLGFTNLLKNDDAEAFHSNFQIGVGYSF
ncbi:MAG: porin family protein [Solitalea sp.]